MEDIFNSWVVNKYIAHRGFYDDEHPENSLGAFEKAIEHEYVIEFDIMPISDGTPVVFHDETLTRMTGKDGYVKKIKDQNELKNYMLKGSNEHISTLEEVLSFIGGRTPVIIEIKEFDRQSGFENRVKDILSAYKGEFAIMSFNPYTLKWFKLNAPEFLRGQLASFFKGEKLSFFKKFVLKRMKLNKKVSEPHFIAYKWEDVPNRFVNRYKELPLLVWAVPSQSDYMKIAPHCDNIIFEHFEPRI